MSEYTVLHRGVLPAGWKFCAHCGRPMVWREVESDSFDRRTGERWTRYFYRCHILPFDNAHDSAEAGLSVASYLFQP